MRAGRATRQRGVWRWIVFGKLALLAGIGSAVAAHLGLNAWLQAQRPHIEQQIARATGAPARLGSLRLVWHGFEPLLQVRDAELLLAETGAPGMSLRGLRVGVAIAPLLAGEVRLSSLRMVGLKAQLREDADGHWRFTLNPDRPPIDWLAQVQRLARLDYIGVRDIEIALVGRSGGSVPLLLQRGQLIPEPGGWRVSLTALTADRSGRLEADGYIRGVAETPEQWRHHWLLSWRGRLDPRPVATLLRPDSPELPRLEGAELDLELRRQGGDGSHSWLASLSGETAEVRLPDDQRSQQLRLSATARISAQALSADVAELTARAAEGGRLRARGLRLRAERQADSGLRQVSASGRAIDLALLSPWLSAYRPGLPALAGTLEGPRLVLQRAAAGAPWRADYRGRVQGLALEGGEYRIAPLALRFSGDETGGQAELVGQAVTVALPKQLFTPLRDAVLQMRLRWQPEASGWRVTGEAERLAAAGAEASGNMQLALPSSGPARLELDLGLAAGDLNRLKPWMPQRWKARLRDYLAQALVAGRVRQGRLQLATDVQRGWWRAEDTEFRVDLEVDDAELRFRPEWPAIREAAAALQIRRERIAIRLEQGAFGGLRLPPLQTAIELTGERRLMADVRHAAPLPRWYALLRQTPLAERLAGLLEQTRPEGDAVVDLALEIPLADPKALTASGRVGLDGALLEVRPLGAQVTDLQGSVHFVNASVAAEQLSGRLHGRPVSASLDTRDGLPRLSAFTVLDIADGDGLARFVPESLRRHFAGELPLTVAMPLRADQDGLLSLELRLGAAGLRSRLPEPLRLAPDPDRAPVLATAGLGEGGLQTLDLRVPGVLHLRHDSRSGAPGGVPRTALHLGPGVAPRGQDGGLYLSGVADVVDLPAWLALMRGAAVAQPSEAAAGGLTLPPLGEAQLDIAHLRAGVLEAPDIRLRARPAGERLRVAVEGSSRGSLEVDPDAPSVTARLERLQLQYRADADPVSDSAEDGGGASAASPDAAWSPDLLPELDMLVSEAWLETVRLGEVDLRVRKSPQGALLDRLRVGGGALWLQASGHWWHEPAADGAVMALESTLTSDRVDALLSALGYARTLEAESAELITDLQWPSMDNLASLAGAQGELRFALQRGTLTRVKPGAGRALFLLSFNALPRRLGLDFRDVTKSGLAFDSLTGSFQIADGNAVTDDLELRGPSMRVEVDGRVGLRARDYDQRIRVYPDLSGGVTLGTAALLGGPIGIGLALVASEVLEKPLDRITRITYHVQGSWDDPELLPGEVATLEDEDPPPSDNGPSP